MSETKLTFNSEPYESESDKEREPFTALRKGVYQVTHTAIRDGKTEESASVEEKELLKGD